MSSVCLCVEYDWATAATLAAIGNVESASADAAVIVEAAIVSSAAAALALLASH